MNYSLDLNTSLESPKLAKEYWDEVEKKGLLGCAITEKADNNPKGCYLELLKYKPIDKILIPGITVNTNYGEVLVYSYSSDFYDYGLFYEDNVSLKRLCDFCNKKKYLVSIAHPFGLISNSATYLMGLNKLEKFIKKNNVGVETFNGVIGYLSYYMYDSFFLRKLRQLLEFFEFHEFFRIIGLGWISKKITHKIDQKSYDMVYKFAAGIKLGKIAKFITAGSGCPVIDRIGSGVLILDLPKKILEIEDEQIKVKQILNRIYNKKIKAVGPPGNYTNELFERSTHRITKKKAYDDLMFLTKRSVK
jgi:hypothetical protein